MRAPAVLLAVPLAVGCGCGLILSDFVTDAFAFRVAAASALCLLAAVSCCGDGRAQDATACVVLGALLAGVSLGESSARRAYHPSLLSWFETADRDARASAVVHGRLREDAAVTATGVLLTIAVTGVERARGRRRCASLGCGHACAGRDARVARGTFSEGDGIPSAACRLPESRCP